jgi:hypothetical protein
LFDGQFQQLVQAWTGGTRADQYRFHAFQRRLDPLWTKQVAVDDLRTVRRLGRAGDHGDGRAFPQQQVRYLASYDAVGSGDQKHDGSFGCFLGYVTGLLR